MNIKLSQPLNSLNSPTGPIIKMMYNKDDVYNKSMQKDMSRDWTINLVMTSHYNGNN